MENGFQFNSLIPDYSFGILKEYFGYIIISISWSNNNINYFQDFMKNKFKEKYKRRLNDSRMAFRKR